MEFVQGGNRRIDRVLDPSFVENLTDLSLESLRERRNLARQEESDLSYVRRMLQGRLEVVLAERGLREEEGDRDLVAKLTRMLSSTGGSAPGSARVTQEPSNLTEDRRYAEQLMGNAGLLDTQELSQEQTQALIDQLRHEERSVSDFRARVQGVISTLTMELGRRYKANLPADAS